MKIVFFAGKCMPIHAGTLSERPIGGTETGLIHVARCLHEAGHAVLVYTSHPSPPSGGPQYRAANRFFEETGADVLVAVQDFWACFAQQEFLIRAFWTGDGPEQYSTYGIGDPRISRKIDLIFCASLWHRDVLAEQSSFPSEKTRLAGNGVDLSLFAGEEERVPARLIYTAAPYRGLVHLLKIFPRIREAIPEAELHIFSDMRLYERGGAKTPQIAHYEREREILRQHFSQMTGVVFRESLLQKDLAREYMKSKLFLYPNIVRETCSITCLEAQAAGCPVLSTQLGALPETVGDGGVLFEGDPSADEYQDVFVQNAVELLQDENKWRSLSLQAKSRIAKEYTWEHVAQRMLQSFEQQLEERRES